MWLQLNEVHIHWVSTDKPPELVEAGRVHLYVRSSLVLKRRKEGSVEWTTVSSLEEGRTVCVEETPEEILGVLED